MLTQMQKFMVTGIIRIRFSTTEVHSIMFLMKHFNQATPQDLLRFLVSKDNEKVKDTQLKYSSAGPKESMAEKISKLKMMDDEEITKLLYDIGFFKDGIMKDTPDCTLSYRITYGPTYGDRVEMVTYTQKDPQYPPYDQEGRPLEDIINRVVKEKLV